MAQEVGQIIDSRELLKDLVKEILQERAEVYMAGDNRAAAEKINLFEDDTFDSDYDGRKMGKTAEIKFPEKIENVLNRNTIDYETIEKQIQNPIKIQPLGFGSKSSTSDQVTSLESDEVAVNEVPRDEMSPECVTGEEETNVEINGSDEVDQRSGDQQLIEDGEERSQLIPSDPSNDPTSSTAADDDPEFGPQKFNIEITPKPSIVGETSIDESENSNIARDSRRESQENEEGDNLIDNEDSSALEEKEEQIHMKNNAEIAPENYQEEIAVKGEEVIVNQSEISSPQLIKFINDNEIVEVFDKTLKEDPIQEPLADQLEEEVEKIIHEAETKLEEGLNEMIAHEPLTVTPGTEDHAQSADKPLAVIREVDTPNLDSISYPDDDLIENLEGDLNENKPKASEIEEKSTEGISPTEVQETPIKDDPLVMTEEDISPETPKITDLTSETKNAGNKSPEIDNVSKENHSTPLIETTPEEPKESSPDLQLQPTADQVVKEIIIDTIEQVISRDNDPQEDSQPDARNDKITAPIPCEDMDLYKSVEDAAEESKKQVSFDINPTTLDTTAAISPNVFKADEQDNVSLLNAFCSDLNVPSNSSATPSPNLASTISFDDEDRAAVATFVEDIEKAAKSLVELPSKIETSVEETAEEVNQKIVTEIQEIEDQKLTEIPLEIVEFVKEIENQATAAIETIGTPKENVEETENEQKPTGDSKPKDDIETTSEPDLDKTTEEPSESLKNPEEILTKEIENFVNEIEMEAQLVSQMLKPIPNVQDEPSPATNHEAIIIKEPQLSPEEESHDEVSVIQREVVDELEKSSLQLLNTNDDSEMEMDSLEVYPTGQDDKEEDTFDEATEPTNDDSVKVMENQSVEEVKDLGMNLNNENSLNKSDSLSETGTEIEVKGEIKGDEVPVADPQMENQITKSINNLLPKEEGNLPRSTIEGEDNNEESVPQETESIPREDGDEKIDQKPPKPSAIDNLTKSEEKDNENSDNKSDNQPENEEEKNLPAKDKDDEHKPILTPDLHKEAEIIRTKEGNL